MGRLEDLISHANESQLAWSYRDLDNYNFSAYEHIYDLEDGFEDGFKLYQDIEEIREVYHQAHLFYISFTIIFSVINFVIFSTICSKKVRSKSPSWFVFHLIAIMLLTSVVVHPILSSGVHLISSYHTCLFLVFLSESFDFMVGGTVLLMNIEIIFTVILPNTKWQNKKIIRFVTVLCVAWIVDFVIVGFVVVHQHKQDEHSMVCIGGYDNWVTWQAFRFWIPSILTFLTSALGITLYVHSRLRGEVAYSQFNEGNGQLTNMTEWTLFLGLTNFIFVFLHVAPVEILLLLDKSVMNKLDMVTAIRLTRYLVLVRNISVLCIPLPFLCVRDVRLAICNMVKRLSPCIKKKRTPSSDQMFDMEAVSQSEQSET